MIGNIVIVRGSGCTTIFTEKWREGYKGQWLQVGKLVCRNLYLVTPGFFDHLVTHTTEPEDA